MKKIKIILELIKKKIGATFDLYIDASLSIDQSWFVTSSSKRSKYQDKTGEEKSLSIYGNILYAFKNFYKHDKLFIDIDSESTFKDDGFHITQSTYKHFVEIFPTATNVKYQTLSIFTKLLKSELDVVDYEEIYSRYKSREISVQNKEDIKTEEICTELKQKTESLKASLAAKEESDSSLAKFVSLVRSYTEVKELTSEILNSFIDKIYIGKPERIDGRRVQEVKIIYKLVGAVNLPQ